MCSYRYSKNAITILHFASYSFSPKINTEILLRKKQKEEEIECLLCYYQDNGLLKLNRQNGGWQSCQLYFSFSSTVTCLHSRRESSSLLRTLQILQYALLCDYARSTECNGRRRKVAIKSPVLGYFLLASEIMLSFC